MVSWFKIESTLVLGISWLRPFLVISPVNEVSKCYLWLDICVTVSFRQTGGSSGKHDKMTIVPPQISNSTFLFTNEIGKDNTVLFMLSGHADCLQVINSSEQAVVYYRIKGFRFFSSFMML